MRIRIAKVIGHFLLCLTFPLCTIALRAQGRGGDIGFRDPIKVGLSLGTMNGLVGGVQWRTGTTTSVGIEADWGAGVARWGMAEQWQVLVRFNSILTTDRVNDVLLIEPGALYGVMYGDSLRTFLDFSPGANVHFVGVVCALGWLHEFPSWSLEFALEPGEALALDGANPGQAFGWGSDANMGARAKGELSFLLRLTILGHF